MLVEVFFGRIDERLASNEATGELLQRFFPGQYQLVRPGADVAEPALEPAPADGCGSCTAPRRSAAPCACCCGPSAGSRRTSTGRASSGSTGRTDPLARVSRRLRERLRVVRPRDGEPAEFLARSGHRLSGLRRRPRGARPRQKAFAAGAVPVVSDLELYRELVGEGERGLLFPLGDVHTLTAQLERLCRDAALRERLAVAARGCRRGSAVGRGRPTRSKPSTAASPAAPRPGRQCRDPRAAPARRLHPLRPAHAHGPLAGLRDPRGAAA